MTKIVVADDDADVLDGTTMVLELYGFDVVPLGDASKILDTVVRVRPDILLQDVFMPGLDVGSLIAAVRARPEAKDTRILIFTASAEAEEVMRRTGADGYVRKPFEADRIRATLEKYLQAPLGGSR